MSRVRSTTRTSSAQRAQSTRPARPPGSRLATRWNAKSDPTIGSPARFARSGSRTRAGAAAGGSSACSDTSEIRGKPRTAARTTSPRTESDSTGRWSARRTSWYPRTTTATSERPRNSGTKQPRTPSKRRTRRVTPDRAVNSSTRSSEPTRSPWRLTRLTSPR